MSYKLFLDDVRNVLDCVHYMHKRIGPLNPIYLEEDWVVVRNYNEFVKTIEEKGVPELISFDHDLAHEHYAPEEHWDNYDTWVVAQNFREKTGHDAAKWLVDYCKQFNVPLPKCVIHSMNPVGCENIKRVLDAGK